MGNFTIKYLVLLADYVVFKGFQVQAIQKSKICLLNNIALDRVKKSNRLTLQFIYRLLNRIKQATARIYYDQFS